MDTLVRNESVGYFPDLGRCINTYGGGILHNNNHSPAIFNFTEDFGNFQFIKFIIYQFTAGIPIEDDVEKIFLISF